MESGFGPVPVTSQKHDPAWRHVHMFKDGDRIQLKCIYCAKIFKGGGIHRIKEHLACQKGNAATCLDVPRDVMMSMQQSLQGFTVKKSKKQKLSKDIHSDGLNPSTGLDEYGECAVNTEIHLIPNPNALDPNTTMMPTNNESMGNPVTEKRKRGRPVKKSLGSIPVGNTSLISGDVINATPINRVALALKKSDNQVNVAIAQFLYDVGVPLDAVNSEYFQPMIDAIASAGTGVVGPTYHDLRGSILKSSLDEAKAELDHYSRVWTKTGCSILVEESNTDKEMMFMNFFVYCPEGTLFFRSADVTNIMNSEDELFKLFREIIDQVGVSNVLQVITPSEDQYIVVGKRLSDTHMTLYWATDVSSSISLILEDFAKLEWINSILEQCKLITRFIYNHSVILSMTRRYTFGVDLIVPGITCSITTFKTLRQIVNLKHNLQALVTSQEWVDSQYSKKEGGLAILDIISEQSFWSSCARIVHLTDPLLRVPGIVDNDKKPAMGYVYAGIYRAKEVIKKDFEKEDYLVYWNIIDQGWQRHHDLPLHAAGFYLNPKFFYSIEGDMPGKIVSGMFDCIERLVPDTSVQDKIIKELNLYKNAAGDFGRRMAIRARETLLPSEWWSTYGGACPNLARLAVRILSQCCCLTWCEGDLIPFEQLHNTRNSLERQRLTDLVFIQYNLRLRQRNRKSKECDVRDAISLDYYSRVEEWVAQGDMCLDDYESSDWVSLQPPSSNAAFLKLPVDEIEELGTGFNDYEIFGGAKDEDDTTGDSKLE